MSLYILEHANAKFVAGLFWQVLSRPREAKAEAKELGESMTFDFLLVRSVGSVMQAGFCARNDGAAEGMTSIAALIGRAIEADDPPLNWMAAVALPSGEYAYAVVRDGALLPDGDIAGSKDDVLNRMTGDFGLGEWDLIVCPSDFGFPNSQEKVFDDFLVFDKKGRHKPIPSTVVEPLKRQIPWKMMGGAVGVLAVAGLGFYFYQNYQAQLEAERQAAMLAEQKARMDAEAQAKANVTPVWATLPDSIRMLKACEEEFFQLPIQPAGWDFEGALCSREGRVKAGFKRGVDGGTVFDIKREFAGKVRTDWSGDLAIHEHDVKFQIAKRDLLLKADDVVEKMVGAAQQLQLKVKVRAAPGAGPQGGPSPVPPAPPGQAPAAGGPQKFAVLEFETQSNIQPSMYERVFTLPGVRPKNVKVTPSGDWTVEGEIYVESN